MTFDPADFIRAQTQIQSPPLLPELKMHLATEVTPLWQQTEETLQQKNLPPPFWAFAWPGGQGAARYILDHPELVRGKQVVDVAAGGGGIALAAMKAGAKAALAFDVDPLALAAIKLNANINGLHVETCEKIDLTRPYVKADLLVAGDICYQQAMSTTLLRWLRLCVEGGFTVILSDPGRAYVPENGLIQLADYTVPTSRDLEDREVRTVTVWRLERESLISTD
jgi:predicted nicotinamide N-methyase